jgi:hypothetical protein
VLLVRGAVAGGDHTRAVRLAQPTGDLADERQDNSDKAAAAKHARALFSFTHPRMLQEAAYSLQGRDSHFGHYFNVLI